MKTLEELQVGKWYQDTSWYSKKDYAKFEKVEIRGVWDQLWHSENISDGNYTKIDNFWDFTISTLREVPLEEIQEFLPEGHPDKISVVEKELTELPKNWEIKATPETRPYIKKYRESIRYSPYDLGIEWIYQTNYRGEKQSKYPEINLEQFKKWVLKEDSSIIQSNLITNNKFKVGDRVRIPLSKKGNIWYKNNVSELDNYNENYFIISGIGSNTNISLSRADGKNFRENSFCEDDLILYVESTNEAWVPKIGDWVYAEKQERGDCREPQHIPLFKIDSISKQADTTFLRPIKHEASGVDLFYCRKAEPWEIPIEEQTTTIYSIQKTGRIDRCESVIDIRFPDTTIKFKDGNYYYGIDPVNMNKPLTPKESFKLNKLPTKSWY